MHGAWEGWVESRRSIERVADLSRVRMVLLDCLRLLKFCVMSRIASFLLQVIVSLFIPDHKADAYYADASPHHFLVECLFGGFDSWDSQYYLSIALNGYSKEEFLVFFPLYPFLMRAMAVTILSPLSLIIPFNSVLLVSGYLLSNATFVLATILLFHLTVSVTANHRLAWYASVFYCINPANVFMCSVYTESLFAFLCLAGMLLISRDMTTGASFFFALAVFTRPNGIVTGGFILYYHLATCLSCFKVPINISKLLMQLMLLSTHLVIILLPFICFQYYAYCLVCHTLLSDDTPPVCNHSIPLVFSFLQQKYWGIGLFNYYETKQILNFLIAAPMVFLLMKCFLDYFRNFSFASYLSYIRTFPMNSIKGISVRGNVSLLPYYIHATFLMFTALTVMHIQVVTRFICSSTPVLFWYSSCTVLKYFPNIPIQSRTAFHILYYNLSTAPEVVLIFVYFLSYNLIGFTLHCNFFPWT